MQHQSHNSAEDSRHNLNANQSLDQASMSRGAIIANASTMVNPARIQEAFAPSIKGFDLNVVGAIAQLINDSGIQRTYEVATDKAQKGPGSLEVRSPESNSGVVTKLLTLELANSEEKARALKEAGMIESAKTYGAVPAFKLAAEQRYTLTEEGKKLIREALVATNAYALGNLSVYVTADDVQTIQQKIAANEIVIKAPTSILDSGITQLGKTASKLAYLDSLLERESVLSYVTTLFKEDLALIIGFSRDVKSGAILRSADDIKPATDEEIADVRQAGELRRIIATMRASELGNTAEPLPEAQSAMTMETFEEATSRLSLSELKDFGRTLIQANAGRHATINKLLNN